MALTKITQGVIKPGENFETHNINSTGVITATQFHGDGSNLTGLSDPSVLTYSGTTKVEAVSTGATVTGNLDVSGSINATSITGDGSGLSNVGGIGDPLGSINNLNYIFTTPEYLTLTGINIIDSGLSSGNLAFTAADSIIVSVGSTLHIRTGTTLRTNILNLY